MKVPTPWGADSPGTEGSASSDRGVGGGSDSRVARSSDGGAYWADPGSLQVALLDWYAARSRTLLIRSTRDPWAILVSEVMAQQTQIARVDEAWSAFMKRFPTPRSLAQASGADVLRAWSGLGYNRRAVNLQRTACIVEAEHAGQVPDDLDTLMALPGIGPYTARAVAAIAFGRPVAPVDTNVRRVVARLLAEPLSTADLQQAADELVEPGDAATWTYASMELGGMVCRARAPLCGSCPLAPWCRSPGRVETPITAGRGTHVPFERTSRWLRGRIVARLRDIDEGVWLELPRSIGVHDAVRIADAVAALEREGLLETRPDGTVRLPSSAS